MMRETETVGRDMTRETETVQGYDKRDRDSAGR